MNSKVISELLKEVKINEIDFTDVEKVKGIISVLFNIIEALANENMELKQERQELRDEVNRLKGEKGKPDIKPNKKNPNKANKENKQEKKNWKKGSKLDKIEIDRTEVVKINRNILPKDVQFKGYQEVVIQNIEFRTDNVLYKLESFYSPTEGKTYTAELPEGLKNTEFGPELKAWCHMLYYECRVTEHKITEILRSNGIIISEGTVSNILIKERAEEFAREKSELYEAGLKSTNYQQIDDTGIRVDGENQYASIVCNENYSAYFINKNKDRETVKKIIIPGYSEIEDEKKKEEMNAIFDILVCDDAKQFHDVTMFRQLCWVHEERHYEKLIPVVPYHMELLKGVISEIWEYYGELKKYKLSPDKEKKIKLTNEFDRIFARKTGYDELDKRLSLTYAKKENLLVVLDYPEVPIHNNASEVGERTVVIKRKISGGVRNDIGRRAWENMLSIMETCKKQSVNFYQYMRAIFAGDKNRLKLADLILQK
jgi:hypothetical protein